MSEVLQLEQQLELNKQMVKYREAVLRLKKNPDFKAVVEDLFLGTECAEYAKASVGIGFTQEQRDNALAMAQAAGYFEQFLQKYLTMGHMAERQMHDIEEQILVARTEEEEDVY